MLLSKKEFLKLQYFAGDIATSLNFGDKLPALNFVEYCSIKDAYGHHYFADNDEHVVIGVLQCKKNGIALERVILHEFRHVWQYRQQSLQKSLQFWRAFCKSHPNEPKFYKLAAHELDAVSFEHTKGNILMGTQVFELFPELSVLEAMPENQILEISLTICKNMIRQDMLPENYV